MANNLDELQSRLDVLERFTLKHLSHLYGAVEPGQVPVTIEDLKQIYVNTKTAPKPPKPPLDARVEGMAGIYKHFSSPKKAKEGD